MSTDGMEVDREELKKMLPILTGKVQACVAKKGTWSEAELTERKIQVICS